MSGQKETVFGAGRDLFRQGEKGGELFFIKSGKVELTVRDAASGKEAVVAVMGAKSVLGTMSFLEGDSRSATGKCKTEVRCVVINQAQREKLLQTIPKWFQVLVKDLSSSLRQIDGKYSSLVAEHDRLKKKLEIVQRKLTESQNENPSTTPVEDNTQPEEENTSAADVNVRAEANSEAGAEESAEVECPDDDGVT